MKTKFAPTPGPWTVAIIGDTGGRQVAEVMSGNDKVAEYMYVEDATIAAAGLDMLAALRAFVAIDDADKDGKALMSAQGQGMDGYTKLANYEACIAAARAAIAKATAVAVLAVCCLTGCSSTDLRYHAEYRADTASISSGTLSAGVSGAILR